MNKPMVAATVTAALALVGCGSYGSYGVYETGYKAAKSESRNEYIPAVGEVSTAEVGRGLVHASLARTTTTYAIKGIKVLQPISTTAVGLSGSKAIHLPPGAVLEQNSDDPRGRFFVYPKVVEDYLPALMFVGGNPNNVKACYHRTGSPGYYGCSDYRAMTPGTDFEYTERTFEKQVPDEVFPKRELVYQGGSNREIRLLFREFTDRNLIKPAFTQSLTFDISKDRVVGFKSMRVEVLEASNTAVRYKVLKHWD